MSFCANPPSARCALIPFTSRGFVSTFGFAYFYSKFVMCDLLKFNLGPRWGLPIDKENDKKILYSYSTISAILSLEVTNTENQKIKE